MKVGTFIFKTISIVVVLTFTLTTIASSAPDLYLRPLAVGERNVVDKELEGLQPHSTNNISAGSSAISTSSLVTQQKSVQASLFSRLIRAIIITPLAMVLLFGVNISCGKKPTLEEGEKVEVAVPSMTEDEMINSEVKQWVKRLGYSDEIAHSLVQMVNSWIDEGGNPLLLNWKRRIEQRRQEYKKGKTSKEEYGESELTIVKEIAQRVTRSIKRDDAVFDLADVIRYEQANCLGYTQFFYILGNTIGFQVEPASITEVMIPGEIGENIHGASLVKLTDGRRVFVDFVPIVIVSRPFIIENTFQKKGEFWELRDKNDLLELHGRFRLLSKDGLIAQLIHSKGVNYCHQQKYSEAISEFNKAMVLDPKYALPYFSRGISYEALGKYDNALLDYNRAIELDAKYAGAYYNRGLIYHHKGDQRKAVLDYTKAITVNPKHVAAYWNRANIFLELKEYQKAISDYSKVIELEPLNAGAYCARGAMYLILGDSKKAQMDFNKAGSLDPSYKRKIQEIYKLFKAEKSKQDKAKREGYVEHKTGTPEDVNVLIENAKSLNWITGRRQIRIEENERPYADIRISERDYVETAITVLVNRKEELIGSYGEDLREYLEGFIRGDINLVGVIPQDGSPLIYFKDQANHQSLHIGEKRQAVYIGQGLYEQIKRDPTLLAAAIAHELAHFAEKDEVTAETIEAAIAGRSEVEGSRLDDAIRRLVSVPGSYLLPSPDAVTHMAKLLRLPFWKPLKNKLKDKLEDELMDLERDIESYQSKLKLLPKAIGVLLPPPIDTFLGGVISIIWLTIRIIAIKWGWIENLPSPIALLDVLAWLSISVMIVYIIAYIIAGIVDIVILTWIIAKYVITGIVGLTWIIVKHPFDYVHEKLRVSTAIGKINKIADPRTAKFWMALIEKLGDRYSDSRRVAIEALGRIGDPQAIPALTKALKDEDSGVRRAIIEALVKIGKPAISALTNLTNALLEKKRLLSNISPTIEEEREEEREYVVEVYTDYHGYSGMTTTRIETVKVPVKVTVKNPEYIKAKIVIDEIEFCLRKIKSSLPLPVTATPVPGLAKKRPNIPLVEKALKEGRIDIGDIQDKRIRAFLHFLKEHSLKDIVIIGGSIRDILFRQDVGDIDVSVKVPLTDEERTAFAGTMTPANEIVLEYSMRELGRLANALGVKVEQFLLPIGSGMEPQFMGLTLQYAGPVEAVSKNGERAIRKRALYDSVTGKIFSSNTGAGLLQMAVDMEGRFYGHTESLKYLIEGKANILGDGKNFQIGDILRLLRLKHQFGLEIEPASYDLIRLGLQEDEKTRPLMPQVLKAVENQLKHIFEDAIDPEAARKELELLGIISIVEKMRKEIIVSDVDLTKRQSSAEYNMDNRRLQQPSPFITKTGPIMYIGNDGEIHTNEELLKKATQEFRDWNSRHEELHKQIRQAHPELAKMEAGKAIDEIVAIALAFRGMAEIKDEHLKTFLSTIDPNITGPPQDLSDAAFLTGIAKVISVVSYPGTYPQEEKRLKPIFRNEILDEHGNIRQAIIEQAQKIIRVQDLKPDTEIGVKLPATKPLVNDIEDAGRAHRNMTDILRELSFAEVVGINESLNVIPAKVGIQKNGLPLSRQ